MAFAIRLPLPPSVNNYWQQGRNGKRFISDRGRKYRDEVIIAIRERTNGVKRSAKAIRLEVRITNSQRWPIDFDNGMKSLADALCHAGLFWDDSQILQCVTTIEAVSGAGWVDIRMIGIGEFDLLPQYAKDRVRRLITETELGPRPRPAKRKVVARQRIRR